MEKDYEIKDYIKDIEIAIVQDPDSGLIGLYSVIDEIDEFRGELIFPCKYKNLTLLGRLLSQDEDIILFRSQDQTTGLYGVIDEIDHTVIPHKYEEIYHPKLNRFLVQDPETHLWGVINYDGREILPCLHMDPQNIKDEDNRKPAKNHDVGLGPRVKDLLAEKAKLLGQDKAIDR